MNTSEEVDVSELTVSLGSYDSAMKKLERRVLPEGTYNLRMKSWKATKGPNGIRVNFVLETFDDDDPDNNGVFVYNNTPISGKGEIFFLETIKAYGGVWEGESVNLAELLNTLVGLSATAQIENVPAQRLDPSTNTYVPALNDDGTPQMNNNIKARSWNK